MNDASVGFQCPSCVSEGAKQTRTGRTAYGGARSGNPALTSIALIVTNVAVWLAILATGGNSSRLVDLLGLRPNGGCAPGDGFIYEQTRSACDRLAGATYLPGVDDGALWQLVTSQFLHVTPWHIGGNMLLLWMLGPQLEASLGRTRFLALYLLSGLAGSVAVLWLSSEGGLTLGASGAVFGLFGAYAVIAHKVGGDLRSIGTLIALNVVITFAVPHVSWQGHLGGLIGGAAIAAVLAYSPRTRRTQVQALGLFGILALLVLLTALRVSALA